MDAIIVGRALGTEALASVGASSPILNLVNGFFLGIASGATVIVSQAYGAGDGERVNKTLHTAMALALTLGVVITAVGIFMAPQILTLIGTPENCMEDAVTYCRIYFGGGASGICGEFRSTHCHGGKGGNCKYCCYNRALYRGSKTGMDSFSFKSDFLYDAFWKHDIFYIQPVWSGSKSFGNVSF